MSLHNEYCTVVYTVMLIIHTSTISLLQVLPDHGGACMALCSVLSKLELANLHNVEIVVTLRYPPTSCTDGVFHWRSSFTSKSL